MPSYSKDMIVVISSPDSYSDVFEIFFTLFRKYWTNCEYEVILSNNKLKPSFENLRVMNNDTNATWSSRVLKAVVNEDTKYVMLLTEDSIITDYINSEQIRGVLCLMKDYDLKYYRLWHIPKPKGKLIDDHEHARLIPIEQPYGRNLGPAIWEKDHLIECLKDGKSSGWEIEGSFLEESNNSNSGNHEECAVDDRDLLHMIHGVSKGKWNPSALRKLRKLGISVDTSKRRRISRYKELQTRLAIYIVCALPNGVRVRLKKTLAKLGFKFVTPY